ncbi:hypothetical protein N692_05480 [Lactiplantibacillus plantarum EGD-AQ4]|nr:hypothetical protein N692_05480 [Lactiplantibacillus plantarum EGD-AQ4]
MRKNSKLLGNLIIVIVLLGVLMIGYKYMTSVKTVVKSNDIETTADKAYSNAGLISTDGYNTKSKFLNEQLTAHNFSGTALFIDNSTIKFQKPYANQDYLYKLPNTINTMFPNDAVTFIVNLVLINKLIASDSLNTNEKISAFNIDNSYGDTSLKSFLNQADSVYKTGSFTLNSKEKSMSIFTYNKYCQKIISSISTQSYQKTIEKHINKVIGLSSFGTYANYKHSMNVAKLYETKKKQVQYDSEVQTNDDTIVATPLSFAIFMKSLMHNDFGLTGHRLQGILDVFKNGKGNVYVNYNKNHEYLVSSFDTKGQNGYVLMGNYSLTTSFENFVYKALGQDTVKGK